MYLIFNRNMFFLPETTPENYRVFFTQGYNIDYYDCHQSVVRILMMMEISLMKWPDMDGIIVIMDVAGGTSSIISKFDMIATYKACNYLEVDNYYFTIIFCLNIKYYI